MEKSQNLEKRIQEIEKRNLKVEENKSWETSLTRRSLIALFTYIAISLYMYAIGVEHPFINAIIPSIGFLLSTLTLPFFKSLWVKYIYKRSLKDSL